jgi:virulence factor Mce-like protein
MERIRRRGLEVTLGILTCVLALAGVLVVWLSFSGDLGDTIKVSAHLMNAGDALNIGDPVAYRNVIIGEVESAAGQTDGSAVAELRLHRDEASRVPANVSAISVPQTLFGAEEIQLVPSDRPTTARLHDGSTLAPSTAPAVESLQTALAKAYNLLTAIHPAELDAALTSLATALAGQGTTVNQLIHQADEYLVAIAPHLGELEGDVRSLATVTNEVADNAPDLLQSLRNLIVVSAGVQRERQAVADLLSVAPTAIDNAQALLNPTNVDNAVTIFRNEVPIAQAFGEDPNALVETIAGFRAFASSFSAAASSGPYLRANLLVTGLDLAQLASLVTNQKGHVFDSISNPPQYTVADCPRYPGMNGPNCTAAEPAQMQLLTTTSARYGGTSSSIGSPAELRVVRAAAATITRLPQALIPDAADLLLGPLLRGVTTVIP